MRGLDEFESAMSRVRVQTEAAAEAVVNMGAMMLVARSQQNFQGAHARGGPHVGGAMPNIVSGDLRRSIAPDALSRISPGVVSTTVAPRMAYGRRVELGMVGADGAGRSFNQAPHPFFVPAVSSIRPDFHARALEVAAAHMRAT